jgi:predicted GIY-YIG superfamily endonuclease
MRYASVGDHYVYRCFDADGDLLYVGCTQDVARRMSNHRRNRKARASIALQSLMASHTVEGPFPTREAAEAAEAEAIRTEQPLLNLQFHSSPGWIQDRRLERYLIDRDIPVATCGLHYCPDCGILRGFHMQPGSCPDCRDAAIEVAS